MPRTLACSFAWRFLVALTALGAITVTVAGKDQVQSQPAEKPGDKPGKPDDKPAKPGGRPANPSGPIVPQEGSLKPGDAAPDFTLKLLDDKAGKTVTLSSLKGKKPVVLIFGSFT